MSDFTRQVLLTRDIERLMLHVNQLLSLPQSQHTVEHIAKLKMLSESLKQRREQLIQTMSRQSTFHRQVLLTNEVERLGSHINQLLSVPEDHITRQQIEELKRFTKLLKDKRQELMRMLLG